MTSQIITFHGGPIHGETHEIAHDGDDVEVTTQRAPVPGEGPRSVAPVRYGLYSRVGDTQDFEWDGWTQ